MNACFKMLGKMSPESDEKLKKILHQESKSFYPEVQERANEYITFTQIAKGDMQLKITSNVPVPKFDNDENEGSNNNVGEEPPIEHKDTIVEEYETDKGYRNLINGASVTGDSSGMGAGKPKKAKKSKAKKENQPAQDMASSQPSQPQPTNNAGGIDLFGDIFGGSAPATTTNTNNTGANNNDIFSLLGNMGGSNPPNAGGSSNQGSGLMDLNSILSGNNAQPQQSTGGADFMNMGGQPQQSNTPQNLKEVFRNNDISIYSSLSQNNNVYTGAFYVSNNTSSQISDVVVNFLVKKYINCQIHSTSGKDLAPNASLGIKKDVTMTNNDPNKGCIIKMSINYSKEGNNVSESKIVTL
jgi:hypothetical protein